MSICQKLRKCSHSMHEDGTYTGKKCSKKDQIMRFSGALVPNAAFCPRCSSFLIRFGRKQSRITTVCGLKFPVYLRCLRSFSKIHKPIVKAKCLHTSASISRGADASTTNKRVVLRLVAAFRLGFRLGHKRFARRLFVDATFAFRLVT